MPNPPKTSLRATYRSPTTSKTFTNPISAALPSSPESPTTAVKEKVNYLSELRSSTKQLQEDLNVFLTQKMEEDRASAAAAVAGQKDAVGAAVGWEKRGSSGEKSKEEVEEERYGEEEVGDEEG